MEKIENIELETSTSSNVIEFEKKTLTEEIQKAANWFYWIAGLSAVNSLIFYFSKDIYFVVGLGITQFVEGIFSELTNGQSLTALVINLIIAGFFILIGFMSNKFKKWAFLTGITLYTLDALLYIIFKEWMAVGFHIFVLVIIIKGFLKIYEYDKIGK